MHICSKKHWLVLVLEIECPPVHHPETVSSEHYRVMKMTTMMIMIDNDDEGDNDDYDWRDGEDPTCKRDMEAPVTE